ncbi:MAG: PD-(D/E)XK nuclease domain-containing protein [Succinivibrio sp.]|nr:PD-(D/E)XK nuclease domain-containing protein [Succinivibrio sp.]
MRSSLFALLGLRVFTHNVSPYFGQWQFIVEHGSCEEIIGLFNSVLSAVSYDKYPINNESVLRALLQLYLLGKDHDVRVEQHNSKGRSDLIVNFPKRCVVIELKFSSDGKNSKSLLKEAANQIKDQEYGTENLGERELIKIAGVFDASKDKRKLTVFQTVS